MPSLAVSNEALLASLRPARQETVFTWLGRTAAFRRVQRWQDMGLNWFADLARWQQSVLSVGFGMLVGLCVLVLYARSLHLAEEARIAAAEQEVTVQRALALAPLQAMVAPAAVRTQQVIEPLVPAAVAPSEAESPPVIAEEAPSAAPEPSSEEPSTPVKRKGRAARKHAKGADGRQMFQKALAAGRTKRQR